ncbi:Uncharacterized protein TCM_008742 isoform 3 [Theobroma cacao]|uniref:Uncharacterized protein isoform 3 n=1 Tax=Theobroma cacao TaxID=3641 RepID=A0A061EC05_THECC|nr:Uncharacterized protein TCM_008742 isoform 3 [Theobroma cacao]
MCKRKRFPLFPLSNKSHVLWPTLSARSKIISFSRVIQERHAVFIWLSNHLGQFYEFMFFYTFKCLCPMMDANIYLEKKESRSLQMRITIYT